MNAERLKNALLTVMPDVHHYKAPAGSTRYIVWSEAGQGKDAWADDRQTAQALRYDATLYTGDEYDAAAEEIQKALAAADISFYLAGAGYLEDANVSFMTWVCEVEYGTA